ncbi:MAG: hypothetical protein GY792_09505 [Gammaproteobacteria bacterium]|nr:hypothetical protein [Gammaproteobacteria bacterium]
MAENKSRISQAQSYEEMVEFWDTHSLADFDKQTYEVEMTFDPTARRNAVNIEPQLLAEVREIARVHEISTQTLINLWLQQQVDQEQLLAKPTP